MYNTIGSSDLIKRMNRALILETIKSEQPISRAQIAKQLSLSKTTVSALVDELLGKRLVVELGEVRPGKSGGRPACMLGFNPSSVFVVGMDIGGTKILIKITDLAGTVKGTYRVPTSNKVEELAALVLESIDRTGLLPSDIIALGIGVPGTVTTQGVVVQAKALQWANLNLRQQLGRLLPFPLYIGNDVNCAAMGERWLGSGDNADNLFFIAIGTGIGSAIISNGALVYGHNNRAGEICYLTSRRDYENGCFNQLGQQGVLEKKVSGTALNQYGYPSRDLFKAYTAGEPSATEIIRDFILELSIAIANTASLLNPERVVIGGGVSESMGIIIEEIRQTVEQLTPVETNVQLATLGGDAGALGAIAFAMHQLEQNSDVSEMV